MNNPVDNRSRQKSNAEKLEDFLLSEKMYYELANLYRAREQYVEAIYYLKKITDESEVLAYKLTLADCYIVQKCYEQALIFLDQIILSLKEKNQFYYVVHLLKIECLVNVHQYDQALNLIESLSMAYYLEEEVYSWQGIVFLKQNEIELARESYKKCLSLQEGHEKAWIGLGSIHCIKADFDLGVACFKRALDINSENLAAYNFIEKYKSKGNFYEQ